MAKQLIDVVDFPMLSVCVHPGCRTVLLGRGRCIAHDKSEDGLSRRGPDDLAEQMPLLPLSPTTVTTVR
jgi:hypothetical protein